MELDPKDRRVLDIAKLQQTQNIDLHGRRIINAGTSIHSSDYVTRAEISGGTVNVGTVDRIPKFAATGLADSKIVVDGPRIIIGSGTAVNAGVLATVKEFVIHSDLTAPTTESAMFVQCGAYVSSSPASVEKIGILSLMYTLDPSNYGLSINRDAVAIDGRGIIVAGNMTGRAWGAYFEGNVQTGADGIVNGIEVSINNDGSDQDQIDSTTGKTGIGLNTRGSFPGTVAVNIVTDWHKGIVTRSDAVRYSFLEIVKASAFTNMFRVKPTGQTLIGDLPNNSSLSDYDPAIYGVATLRTNFTLVDSVTNKNLLLFFTDSGTSRHRISTGHYDTPASTWPLSFEINAVQALTINTDGASLFGLTASPVTIAQGNILVKNYIFAASATSNANVAVLAIDSGRIVVGSDQTGIATLFPIDFQIGTDSWLRLQVDGGFTFKASSAAISSSSQGRLRYNSGTNKLQVSENGGAYTDIIGGSGVTGSGTTGTLPKWSSSSALTDSALVEASSITTSKAILPSSDDALDSGAVASSWHKVWTQYVQCNAGSDLRILSSGAHSVYLGVNGGDVWQLTSSGHFLPVANNTYTLGGSSNRPSTVYGVAGDFSGTVTGNLFSGSGASLTSLPAANLTGSIADARLSANIPLKNAANTFTAQINLTSQNVVFSNGFGVGNSGSTAVAFASGGLEFYVGGNLKGTIGSSDTTLVIDGTVRTLHYTAGTCTLT